MFYIQGNHDAERQTCPESYINNWLMAEPRWETSPEPFYSSSCGTSRLTSQKAACHRDGFSGKERLCWHNGPGNSNTSTQIHMDQECCSSVWIIPWTSSQGRFQRTGRPRLRTQSAHLEAFAAHQLLTPTPSFPCGCKLSTVIKSKKEFFFNN